MAPWRWRNRHLQGASPWQNHRPETRQIVNQVCTYLAKTWVGQILALTSCSWWLLSGHGDMMWDSEGPLEQPSNDYTGVRDLANQDRTYPLSLLDCIT